MICSIVVIIGRHLSVKETGLIAICFRLEHIGIRSGERGKADRMTCFTKAGTKDNDYIMVYLPVATNVWRGTG